MTPTPADRELARDARQADTTAAVAWVRRHRERHGHEPLELADLVTAFVAGMAEEQRRIDAVLDSFITEDSHYNRDHFVNTLRDAIRNRSQP